MDEKQSTLERVSKETILLSAHRRLPRRFKQGPLWSFVAETCAVGSTSAIAICRELGWNPHQDGTVRLERKA